MPTAMTTATQPATHTASPLNNLPCPMDLKSGYPFWAIKNGLIQAFPQLQQDLRCEVLVIGGGITGALIADELARNGGHEVVVIEQRDIGWGSTAASTAMLQFEIDTPMVELARQYGQDNAAAAYLACARAIDQINVLCQPLGEVDFQPLASLYYASSRRDGRHLREEYALRQRYRIQQQWLEPDEILQRYGFAAPAAILSAKAARVDPYRLTYRLFSRLASAGVGIYDRTCASQLRQHGQGMEVTTSNGARITCNQVVLATGYQAQQWLQQPVARNRSSYAMVTDPIDPDQLGFLRHTMLWETARPYLYMRSTGDNRLLIGGEDDALDIPARRDARVQRKAQKLLKKVQRLLPSLPMQTTFSWAGTFAETADGLPFFGAHRQWGPRVLFAMAYGGNGITYSMTGAELLRAAIEGRSHRLSELYGFARLD